MQASRKTQAGYALIAVIAMLAGVALLASLGLAINAQGIRIIGTTDKRVDEHMRAENAINHAVAWLRTNSQKIIYPFCREQFYNSFQRVTPDSGANDNNNFNVASSLRIKNTDNTAFFANKASLGTAQYPSTFDVSSNTSFAATQNFSSADFGPDARVRVTLVDAQPLDPTKDFGPPPAPEPQTDFVPVYRIDAGLRPGLDSGAHIFATVTSHLVHRFDYGIYGEDYLELRQQCDSYHSAVGAYNAGIRRANCIAGSNSTSAIHKSEEIYGVLRTNGTINASPPFGGETCADFLPNCPNKGETCSGDDCGVPLLDDFQSFISYCPTDLGNKTVNLANENLTLPADAETTSPRGNCWNSITIQGNSKLTLTKVGIPYFIKTLTLQNNSNSQFDINPDVPGGTIEVYVETITGNAFNGNQMINTTNRPSQLIFNYIGTNALTLNGNAAMNIAFTAPFASVTVSGNFSYHGALLAKRTYLQGSGGFHYDESLGGMGPVTDAQFRIRELVPLFR